MSVQENKIRISELNIEDWLEPGVDAQEFAKTLEQAFALYIQTDWLQRRGVEYAWKCGDELLRAKHKIRRGYWTEWKEAQDWASARKIEMYTRIADKDNGFMSAEEASQAATTIVGADAVLRARRKAKKQGRILTKSEEAEVEKAASLGINTKDMVEETVTQSRRHLTNSLRPDHPSERHLLREYGITLYQWQDQFKKQGRVCAICRSEDSGTKNGWHTDHDHLSGRVRGILCHNCNTSLGWFEKRKRTIMAYVGYRKIEGYR